MIKQIRTRPEDDELLRQSRRLIREIDEFIFYARTLTEDERRSRYGYADKEATAEAEAQAQGS